MAITLEINDIIVEKNVDLMFISETWINNSDKVKINELVPKGYDILLLPRTSRTGGGVAIIYRLSLQITHIPQPSHSTFEICSLKIKTKSTSLHCSCVYRPTPSKRNNGSFNSFIMEFNDFLETLTSQDNLCICGDFNVHFEDVCDPAALKLKKLLTEHGLTQLITGPTHIKGHTLDLIITRDAHQELFKHSIFDLCLSDHFIISLSLPYCKPKSNKMVTNSRNIKSIDLNEFKSNISKDLHESMNCEQDLSLSLKFTSCLSNVLNKFAPLVTRKIYIRPYAPWINLTVKAQKQIRRKAQRLYVKTGLTVHKDILRHEKNKTIFTINDEKKKYISEKIESSGSSKELFSVFNDMTGKNKTPKIPTNIPSSQLPDKFNNFFIDKIDVIRDELDLISEHPIFKKYDGVSFSIFTLVDEKYVTSIIMKSKKCFCELDPLPGKLFYECLDVMIPFITTIFNESLSNGVFPTDLKESIVIPLLKKESLDCDIFKNYRPVTNLPFISKVLERIAYSQIVDHVTKNELTDMFQSAYKSRHSTETALLKVVNDILCAIDDGNVTLLTLLDLSAAFDTIDHTILLERLKISFGIDGVVLDWIRSYLSDRKQKVKVNNDISSEIPVKYGVPQGSVLGPLLFTMYVYPLTDVFIENNMPYHTYADDNQLHPSCPPKEFSKMTTDLSNCSDKVDHWMTVNKLKKNNDKTEMMPCGTKAKLNAIVCDSATIGGAKIPFSSKVRNLGLIIDNSLTMDNAVSNIRKCCYFEIRKIAQLRPYLTEQATIQLVISFVISRLDYCNSLFYNMTEENVKRLQLIQNHAARVVKNASKSCSASSLLFSLHWLPIKKRIVYKIAILTYNCLNDIDAPKYLKDMIEVYVPSRTLRSCKQSLLVVPKKNLKTYGERSFSYAAPNVWNKLPEKVKSAESLNVFKKNLKTYLFTCDI